MAMLHEPWFKELSDEHKSITGMFPWFALYCTSKGMNPFAGGDYAQDRSLFAAAGVNTIASILAARASSFKRETIDHRVTNGASPRASQSLFKTGRAAAAIAGRNYVIPDDIKDIALQIISHRINMKPEAKIRGITGMHIVRKILSEVPVPVIQPA